ncbi:Dihydroorotate dehydrogenase-domain-containing protein [Cristinia sonorae]|uniref:Dihydroorotate dehydrogenase (quinone), mitochondrial n=1 Tax=Cristinia sonorae TaxID=1940300 RepID=A0A8K0UYL4_9AGAR|nr:Dihydroorotate dehydrogenase-domain-containing protein [Cristinia sonorae]
MASLAFTRRQPLGHLFRNRPLAPHSIRHTSTSRPLTNTPVRTTLYLGLFAVSTGLFAVYYFDCRSAIHRYVFTPLLRYGLDAEAGHKLAVKALGSGLGPRDTQKDDPVLQAELWGEHLNNPIGLAAGFDKHGEAVDGLLNLGFSWVEIGSVTPKPQPGNPKPRVFHLVSDNALINRYGFPSEGHVAVLARLRERIPTFKSVEQETHASLREGTMLAVNLGKNKSSPPDSIADFVSGVKAFSPFADVLVVNVSSPNTPGLRGLQTRSLLEELLAGVVEARDAASATASRKPKIVLKIAPDLTEKDVIDIAEAVRASNIDGVIVSNTTISRPPHLRDGNKVEAGGLSGAPLKPLSVATLRTLRAHLPAHIPLIGCGGINSGVDALDYAKAGASLVQVYTGFGYDGVGMCRRVKDELAAELKKAGTTWGSVVKKSVAELSLKEQAKVKAAEHSFLSGGDPAVRLLIEEAEELKRLVDQLGERMKNE